MKLLPAGDTAVLVELGEVRAGGQLAVAFQLRLDGQLGNAGVEAGAKTFETIDPATARPISSVAHGDASDVDRAVRAACDQVMCDDDEALREYSMLQHAAAEHVVTLHEAERRGVLTPYNPSSECMSFSSPWTMVLPSIVLVYTDSISSPV